jgi:predicted CXXCH cytochrome family protein
MALIKLIFTGQLNQNNIQLHMQIIRQRLINLCFLIVVIWISGCSTNEKHKVLSFIFDGVPDPNEIEVVIADDHQKAIDSLANQEITEKTSKPLLFIHKPYQERKCNDCHDQNNIGRLQDKMPELCYNCHEDLENKYDVLHGPVGGGYCNTCHNAHNSKYENLLTSPGTELCNECHAKEDVFKNKIHDGFIDHDCMECHNPHGGNDRFVLQAGSCFKCHDNSFILYKYTHGPVAGGYCNACHGSHTMGVENLLIRPGQQLCTYCHEKEEVFKNDVHADIGDSNCTECHNAHGGITKIF